jgi:hypothetical protein
MISSGSAIVEGSAITASRALASDAGGLPVASTTTSTELGYVSGVTSAVQTQINAKADTSALTAHTGASTGVHGVAGSVVGTTDAQVLTNKDIDGGTASNTSRTTLPKASKSTLDALTRKQATLVYGSDTNKVYADDGSTLKEIGSGSSGINYLNSQFNADALGTVELSVGDTLASTTRANPDQWGNSAASALITQSTNSTLRGTTNYLVAFSANAQFVESPLFSIDGQDLSKPLLVQFDVSGVATADDVQVYIARYNSSNVLQERILVAGTASATSPNSAQVPTAVTTFRGFFIPSSTATDKYSIRWRRNANNTSMRLDTFIVGPQSLAQAAVVTGWQSYTPTFTNFGTVTGITAWYRRVGDSIQIFARYVTGSTVGSAVTISLPSGLNTDVSKSGSASRVIGRWYRQVTIASNRKTGSIIMRSSTQNVVSFGSDDYSTAVGPLDEINGSSIAGPGETHTCEFTVPIAEWSSGTTTLADRAVEEYAWNTNTTTSLGNGGSDTTSFGNGPQGIAVASFTTSGVNTPCTRRVRFTTPILSTDSVFLEIFLNNQWMKWTDFYTVLTINSAGTARAGITVIPVSGSTTDYDVNFYGAGPSLTADTQWADAVTRSARWRVRKVSGGATVGFPVSARNVVGDTSGTAVPAGYVGELKTVVQSATISMTTATNWTNVGSVTLTPGIWSISMGMQAVVTSPGVSFNEGILLGFSTDSTSAMSDFDISAARANSVTFSHTGPITTVTTQQRFGASGNLVPITVNANTTYYFKVRNTVTSGTCEFIGGRLICTRIA